MAVEFTDVDLEQRAVADLLSQDRGKPRFESLVLSLAYGAEYLDALFEALVTTRDFGATVPGGKLLDQWGNVVGQPRGALTDAEYYNFIQARPAANRSTGTVDEIAVVAQIAGDCDVHVLNMPPAAYIVEWFPSTPFSDGARNELRRIMDDARPMGVGATYVEATETDTLTIDSSTAGQRVGEGKIARSF